MPRGSIKLRSGSVRAQILQAAIIPDRTAIDRFGCAGSGCG